MSACAVYKLLQNFDIKYDIQAVYLQIITKLLQMHQGFFS